MLRMAFIIIVIATAVGALMPAGQPSANDERAGPLRVEAFAAQSSSPTATGTGEIRLERSYDGHFYADARVNGTPVRFLVDTGASGIALSAGDARRAGVTFHSSQAEVIGTGASGQVLGHHVRLAQVELGHASARDAPAVILQDGDRSLLGQSFLSQFDSVAIQGNRMVLR